MKKKAAPRRSILDEKGNLKPEYKAYSLMLDSGESYDTACEAIGYSTQSIDNVKEDIEKTWAKRLDEDADKVIKNTLRGLPTGETDSPKVSDCLSAAKMVKDRTDPPVQYQRVDKRVMSIDVTPERERQLDDILSRHYLKRVREPKAGENL